MKETAINQILICLNTEKIRVNIRYCSTHKYYTLYNGIHYLYRSMTSIVSILFFRNAWNLEALYVDSEIYLSLNLPLACRIKYVTIIQSFKHSFLESLYASFLQLFCLLKKKTTSKITITFKSCWLFIYLYTALLAFVSLLYI